MSWQTILIGLQCWVHTFGEHHGKTYSNASAVFFFSLLSHAHLCNIPRLVKRDLENKKGNFKQNKKQTNKNPTTPLSSRGPHQTLLIKHGG